MYEVYLDCPSCGSSGTIEQHRTFVRHRANCFKLDRPLTAADMYATCDCPRLTEKNPVSKETCRRCNGSKKAIVKYPLPKPGMKVTVTDKKLLTAIFGKGEEPADPGKVYAIQTPEEHGLELASGIGIQVTWDRLTGKNEIPKGSEVTLWTFDLTELQIAK